MQVMKESTNDSVAPARRGHIKDEDGYVTMRFSKLINPYRGMIYVTMNFLLNEYYVCVARFIVLIVECF